MEFIYLFVIRDCMPADTWTIASDEEMGERLWNFSEHLLEQKGFK